MGKHRLKGDAERLLAKHNGWEGHVYRAAFSAAVQAFGPLTPLARMEASRMALAWVQLMVCSRTLSAAQRKRRVGRGRKPSMAVVERLARRQGLADGSFSAALERFQRLAGERKPAASIHELLAAAKARRKL